MSSFAPQTYIPLHSDTAFSEQRHEAYRVCLTRGKAVSQQRVGYKTFRMRIGEE